VTSERRQEIRKVLAGALERTPQERSAYLDQVCAEGDYPRARSLYAECLAIFQGLGDGPVRTQRCETGNSR